MEIISAFGKSGYHVESLLAFVIVPADTSFKIAVAIKVFVILAIRNGEFRSTGILVLRLP